MGEKTKLVVISVVDEEISTKIQGAKEDYSAIYDVQLFKQQYDKKEKVWLDTPEAQKQYEKELAELGGLPAEDDIIEVFLDEESGKGYVFEAEGFTKVEKPLSKDKSKLYKDMVITEVRDTPKGREVLVDRKGTIYSFAFNTSVWVAKLEKFIPNPAKLAKAKKNFNELFEDVNVTWDEPEKAIGLIVTATVQENQLNPSSEFGWLKPSKLDPEDQPEPKEAPSKLDISDDDLPF